MLGSAPPSWAKHNREFAIMASEMKTNPYAITVALLLSGFIRAASPDGLPIRLGSTSAEVRKVLGEPTDIVEPQAPGAGTGHEGQQGIASDKEMRSVYEWYYSAGILGTFSCGKLTAISLFKETDYPSFVPYSGTIVKGVTLQDSKKAILEKLGAPAKIEDETLAEGTDPDRPVITPQQSKYFWRIDDYTVEVTLLNQARLIKEAGPITLPKDTILFIRVSR